MADSHTGGAAEFRIIFKGRPIPGRDPDLVRENLKKLFRLNDAGMARLFSGERVIIRKRLSRERAEYYRGIMKKAGAFCDIESMVMETPVRETPAMPVSPRAADKTTRCPECNVQQSSEITCTNCGCDLQEYRQDMASRGFVDVPNLGYIKNRRLGERRIGNNLHNHISVESDRRSTGDRRWSQA